MKKPQSLGAVIYRFILLKTVWQFFATPRLICIENTQIQTQKSAKFVENYIVKIVLMDNKYAEWNASIKY